MNKTFIVFICAIVFRIPCLYGGDGEKYLLFNPNETESMLFLYNQTKISGGDVEMVAALGAKLKTGLKEARAVADSTQLIPLELTENEIRFCLRIIRNSTFEARYAQLVQGMKKKLEKRAISDIIETGE